MDSDIILDNTDIKIIANRLSIERNSQQSFEFNCARPLLTIGNSHNARHASLYIRDKNHSAYMSSSKLSIDRIVSNTVQVQELEIATYVQESLHPGKIKIIGKNGEPAIILNGESGAIEFSNSTSPMIYMLKSGTENADKMILSHSKTFENWGLLYRDKGDKMIFKSQTNSALSIDLMQTKVGVGTDNPTHTLHVEGEVAGRGNFISLSDEICKKNITNLSTSIEKIMHLRGISFNWNENELTGVNAPKEKQFGFIAQEVQKVFPEIVSKDNQGRHMLAYSSLIPILVEGIKEQQNKIDTLETKLNNLIEKVDELTHA